jgi:hypothetical protein
VFGLLESWGGAFGLVFGLIGTILYWVERDLLCCCKGEEGEGKKGADIELHPV